MSRALALAAIVSLALAAPSLAHGPLFPIPNPVPGVTPSPGPGPLPLPGGATGGGGGGTTGGGGGGGVTGGGGPLTGSVVIQGVASGIGAGVAPAGAATGGGASGGGAQGQPAPGAATGGAPSGGATTGGGTPTGTGLTAPTPGGAPGGAPLPPALGGASVRPATAAGGTTGGGGTNGGGSGTGGAAVGAGALPAPAGPGGVATPGGDGDSGASSTGGVSDGAGLNPDAGSGDAAAPGGATAGGDTAPNPAANPRAAASRRKKGKTSSLADWQAWWAYNRERFFDLRGREARFELNADLENGDQGAAPQRQRLLRGQISTLLQRSLHDDDFSVRAHAVLALARVGYGRDLRPYRRALADDDWRVGNSAVVALGILGDAEAAKVLSSIAFDTLKGRRAMGVSKPLRNDSRVYAALSLGLIGCRGDLSQSHAMEDLMELVEGRFPTSDINCAALEGLGLMRATEVVPQLVVLLADPTRDARIRSVCATTLGKIGHRGAIPELVEALSDRKTSVRRSAAVALGLLAQPSDRTAAAALRKSLKSDADLVVRNFATIALGEMASEEDVAFLRRQLRAKGINQRSFSALALGVWASEHPGKRPAELGEELVAMFDAADSPDERGAAAIAMGLVGHRDGAARLRALLARSGQAGLRRHVALALGLMGEHEAITELRETLKEIGDSELRTSSALALGMLGDHAASDLLEELVVKDASVGIRGAALQGLGRIGGQSALMGLGEVLANREGRYDDRLRGFAASALGRLGDEDPMPILARVSVGSNYVDARGAILAIYRGF